VSCGYDINKVRELLVLLLQYRVYVESENKLRREARQRAWEQDRENLEHYENKPTLVKVTLEGFIDWLEWLSKNNP